MLKKNQVRENVINSVEVDGRPVIVTQIDGNLFAFGAKCPHASGDLRAGTLHRGRITCPTHGWKFDIQTGRCYTDQDCRLRRYRIELEGADGDEIRIFTT